MTQTVLPPYESHNRLEQMWRPSKREWRLMEQSADPSRAGHNNFIQPGQQTQPRARRNLQIHRNFPRGSWQCLRCVAMTRDIIVASQSLYQVWLLCSHLQQRSNQPQQPGPAESLLTRATLRMRGTQSLPRLTGSQASVVFVTWEWSHVSLGAPRRRWQCWQQQANTYPQLVTSR